MIPEKLKGTFQFNNRKVQMYDFKVRIQLHEVALKFVRKFFPPVNARLHLHFCYNYFLE